LSEEFVDVLGGGVKAKAAVHRDGDWHVVAHVWIVTPDGRVLLQRRATMKENWPGYWDVSAAGHLSAGESAIDAAIRETREELGLAIAADDLTHIGTVREQCVLNGGTYVDNEVHEVFVVVRDVDLDALTLQASEVDDVRFVALHEMQTIAPLVPHAEEYALLSEWWRTARRSR
jgi:isopentenyldiphosphate isomerase